MSNNAFNITNNNLRFSAALSALLIFLLSPLSGVASQSRELAFWLPHDEKSSKIIDHTEWQVLLDKYLITRSTDGINRFNYGRVIPEDRNHLTHYLSFLEMLDPRAYARAEQKAYWINLYNAVTVKLIIDHYPVKSIKKLGQGLLAFGPWDDPLVKIADQALSLNDIEHKILRPIFRDSRIHFAVNCASIGCPNLSALAYTPQNIEQQLDQGARAYVNHRRGVRFESDELIVSSIFHWYKEDFGGTDKSLLHYLSRYAEPALEQKLKTYGGKITHEYDWSLNGA